MPEVYMMKSVSAYNVNNVSGVHHERCSFVFKRIHGNLRRLSVSFATTKKHGIREFDILFIMFWPHFQGPGPTAFRYCSADAKKKTPEDGLWVICMRKCPKMGIQMGSQRVPKMTTFVVGLP